jgi:hypothetical protein
VEKYQPDENAPVRKFNEYSLEHTTHGKTNAFSVGEKKKPTQRRMRREVQL